MSLTLADFRKAHARAIARLHARALDSVPPLNGELSADAFAEALLRSANSHFRGASPSPQAAQSYLDALHVADLALACACAHGSERAWEHFMSAFRPGLYAAARAVAGHSAGRELADSLYADLYGLQEREGRRRSLFDYFHGRSKLSTWLRAVLAQRQVDAVRAARRTVSLDVASDRSDAIGDGHSHSASLADSLTAGAAVVSAASLGGQDASAARAASATVAAELEPDRLRYLAVLQAALTAALQQLAPRDRLRLCYYYVQDLTLAQIGRLLGEHEATVSRKLDRIRAALRAYVDHALREEKKFSDAQISLCYEYAREQWPFDLAGVLTESK